MHHLTAAHPLLPRSESGRSTGRGVPKTTELQPKPGDTGLLDRPRAPDSPSITLQPGFSWGTS